MEKKKELKLSKRSSNIPGKVKKIFTEKRGKWKIPGENLGTLVLVFCFLFGLVASCFVNEMICFLNFLFLLFYSFQFLLRYLACFKRRGRNAERFTYVSAGRKPHMNLIFNIL